MDKTTAIVLYEKMLIRLSKQNVQSLLVDDFIEYINLASLEFITKRLVQSDRSQGLYDDIDSFNDKLIYTYQNGKFVPNIISKKVVLDTLVAEITALDSEIDTLESTIVDLKQKLMDIHDDAIIGPLYDQLTQARSDLRAQSAVLTIAKSNLEKIEKTINDNNLEVQNTSQNLNILQNELSLRTTAYETELNKFKDLVSQRDKLDDDDKDNQILIADREASLSKLESSSADVKTDVTDSLTELDAQKALVRKINSDIQIANLRISDNNTNISITITRLNEARQNGDTNKAAQFNKDLQALYLEKAKAEQALITANNPRAVALTKLELLQAKYNRSVSTAESIDEQIRDTRAGITQLRRISESINEQAISITNEIGKQDALLRLAQEAIDTFKDDISKKSNSLSYLKIQGESYPIERNKILDDIVDATKLVNDSKDKKANLEIELTKKGVDESLWDLDSSIQRNQESLAFAQRSRNDKKIELDQSPKSLEELKASSDNTNLLFTLPEKYLHLDELQVTYKILKQYGVYRVGDIVKKSVTRIPIGAKESIEEDSFLKPTFDNPYYRFQMHPENGTQKEVEVYYGNLNNVMRVDKVLARFFATPVKIYLTEEQLDLEEDTSQVLNLPRAVSNEIVKIAVKLFLENIQSARLQTNAAVNPDFKDVSAGQR